MGARQGARQGGETRSKNTSPLYVPIKLFLAAGGGDPKT